MGQLGSTYVLFSPLGAKTHATKDASTTKTRPMMIDQLRRDQNVSRASPRANADADSRRGPSAKVIDFERELSRVVKPSCS